MSTNNVNNTQHQLGENQRLQRIIDVQKIVINHLRATVASNAAFPPCCESPKASLASNSAAQAGLEVDMVQLEKLRLLLPYLVERSRSEPGIAPMLEHMASAGPVTRKWTVAEIGCYLR